MVQTDTVLSNLNKRRFLARRFSTAEEAKAAMLEIIGKRSVGIGGSNSITTSGIYEELLDRGNQVFSHTQAPKAEKMAVRKAAMEAEVYLCSANAITEDGIIVNIDGTGNRVAATIFGPETVIMLVGENKLVSSVEEGIARTKSDCCPKNARRIGVDTPCAATGQCTDCKGTSRMCNVTILHEYPTRATKAFYVFIVDGTLGW